MAWFGGKYGLINIVQIMNVGRVRIRKIRLT